MKIAGLMDMAMFCVYVGCLVVFVVLVLPQAFYLFLTVDRLAGLTAFIIVALGSGWVVNQLRKMVIK